MTLTKIAEDGTFEGIGQVYLGDGDKVWKVRNGKVVYDRVKPANSKLSFEVYSVPSESENEEF